MTSGEASIPEKAIDHDLARGFDPGDAVQGKAPSGWSVLLTNQPLLVFAVCCALFHLANAAMLTLVSQQLAQVNLRMATPLTSACIVAAQVVIFLSRSWSVPRPICGGANPCSWRAS